MVFSGEEAPRTSSYGRTNSLRSWWCTPAPVKPSPARIRQARDRRWSKKAAPGDRCRRSRSRIRCTRANTLPAAPRREDAFGPRGAQVPGARKSGSPQDPCSPEEMPRARLAAKARAELVQHAIALHENAPEALCIFRVRISDGSRRDRTGWDRQPHLACAQCEPADEARAGSP